jgi:hypothetical protein
LSRLVRREQMATLAGQRKETDDLVNEEWCTALL